MAVLALSSSIAFAKEEAQTKVTPESLMEIIFPQNKGSRGEGETTLYKLAAVFKDKGIYRKNTGYMVSYSNGDSDLLKGFYGVKWLGRQDKLIAYKYPEDQDSPMLDYYILSNKGKVLEKLGSLPSEIELVKVSDDGKTFLIATEDKNKGFRSVFNEISNESPIFYIVRRTGKGFSEPVPLVLGTGSLKACVMKNEKGIYCTYLEEGKQSYLKPFSGKVAHFNPETGEGKTIGKGPLSSVIWKVDASPNGKHLLFVSDYDSEAGKVPQNNIMKSLYVTDIDGNVVQRYEMKIPHGWIDDKTYVATWTEQGMARLGIFDIERGLLDTVAIENWGLGFICPVTVNVERPGIITFMAHGPNIKPEIYKYDIKSKKISQVTYFNVEDETKESQIQVISWPTEGGEMIQGFLLTPKDYKENKKYPLLVEINGGPGEVFSPMNMDWWRLYTDQGYIVLLPNVRGSSGFGAEFLTKIGKNLGVWDAEDVVAGINYLSEHGVVDRNRVSIQGTSYGGYLVGQILTKYPFIKSAAITAGITDFLNRGLTDQDWVPSAWLGPLGENYDLWRERSPLVRADKIKTPTYFFQGEEDRRVSPEGMLTLATVLKARGVPIAGSLADRSDHFSYSSEGRYRMLKDRLAFHMKWNPPVE